MTSSSDKNDYDSSIPYFDKPDLLSSVIFREPPKTGDNEGGKWRATNLNVPGKTPDKPFMFRFELPELTCRGGVNIRKDNKTGRLLMNTAAIMVILDPENPTERQVIDFFDSFDEKVRGYLGSSKHYRNLRFDPKNPPANYKHVLYRKGDDEPLPENEDGEGGEGATSLPPHSFEIDKTKKCTLWLKFEDWTRSLDKKGRPGHRTGLRLLDGTLIEDWTQLMGFNFKVAGVVTASRLYVDGKGIRTQFVLHEGLLSDISKDTNRTAISTRMYQKHVTPAKLAEIDNIKKLLAETSIQGSASEESKIQEDPPVQRAPRKTLPRSQTVPRPKQPEPVAEEDEGEGEDDGGEGPSTAFSPPQSIGPAVSVATEGRSVDLQAILAKAQKTRKA